jgi:GGDEF domain-containing protein
MTTQMLVQSSRHKAQQSDINQTQRGAGGQPTAGEPHSTEILCQVPNRRNFDEVKVEFRRHSNGSGWLLICDIELFKGYNDTGHTP